MTGLTGCGVVSSDPSHASEAVISGALHGGQQPIVGATVTLMAPGIGNYGTAGSPIASTVSMAGGAFTLPAYTCPANSGLVYLLATGGNAGGGVNSAIAEAAVLGSCNSLTASTFVNVSEVTTVAAAYALAPFAVVAPSTPATNIGVTSTNLQGLYNAAGTANNLANITTGNAHVTGDVTGIVPPTAYVNTLANILAACVNQGTSTTTTGTCASLFSAATPSGGTAPTDTFQAAVDIAQNPGKNVSNLFLLSAPSAPFQPTLTSAPSDFTLALGYNGGALTLGGGNLGVAIDALGNAWIVTGYLNANVHSLTEISPAGVYVSGSAVANSTGFDNSTIVAPVGIAIDQTGYIWITSNTQNNLMKFNTDGTPKATITATSFSGPNALAFDALGDAWVANFGGIGAGLSNVTEINTSGVEATGSPFQAGYEGVDIAVSPTAVWQTNAANYYLYRIAVSNNAITRIYIGGSVGDVANDHSNNAWLAVTGNGSVYKITDALGYATTPNGGFIVSGARAQNIAIDGLGNVFAGAITSGTGPGTVLEYSNSATLISSGLGYTGSGVIPVAPAVPGGIAIDGSGNIWISGNSNGSSTPIYVSEIVGLAAPVVTPRATATTNNTLGTRP